MLRGGGFGGRAWWGCWLEEGPVRIARRSYWRQAGGTRGLVAHLSFGGLPREPCFMELGGDPLTRVTIGARLERCPH